MLRALAKQKSDGLARPGSMTELIRTWQAKTLDTYAEATKYDYELMLPYIELAFSDHDAAEVTPADVQDFVDQWTDKPRQANKYLHVLSMIFDLGCVRRYRHDNPCAPVKNKKIKKRTRYITNEEFYAIRKGALISKDERKVPSGVMTVCMIDLAYLTFQRMQEVRLLKITSLEPEWIAFEPAKTKGTTGAKVRWFRTPEINKVLELAGATGKVKSATYVFHNLKGQPYTKSGVETAWDRACERAKVEDANFHDLRGKAQTDAKKAGFTMQQIQDGATHSSVTTTEGYIKGREVVDSAIVMNMPRHK